MRLASMKGVLPPVILCNAEQRFLVAEQLREAEIEPGPVILEPVARSTAPAIAIAALHTPLPEETVMIVMPADHFIADHESFQQAVQKAAALAMTGKLMTMGIRPTFAHTGFGYIEQGKPLLENKDAFTVNRFKEKPDAKTAQSYVDAGTYLWNSGIFVLRADAYISELERLQPAIVGACREALAKSKTDLDFLRLHEASFAKAPDISIDYAVMEQARNVAVLPVSFEWNDIGGWPALWQIGEKDENGNVTKGDVVLKDTTNSYIRSDNRLVSVIGLDNVVVVDTSDALLVANKSRVDEVKDVVAQLKHDHRSEGDTHARVWRPWGYYEQLDSGHRFQVKQIMVKPGGKLSLQKHHHRAEHWIVVSGTAKVQCDDEIKLLGPNESIYIPLGSLHRLENPGLMPLFLIEVQSGDYLGEDDIVRFEDIYKRNDH